MFFAPGGPLLEHRKKRQAATKSKRSPNAPVNHLGMWLEEHVALHKAGRPDARSNFLKRLPIPNRPYAQVPPRSSALFPEGRPRTAHADDRELREPARENGPHGSSKSGCRFSLRHRRQLTYRRNSSWRTWEGGRARFQNTAKAVEKLRARGGKIVFVHFPHSGQLKELEDRLNPRTRDWERLLKETGAPGIYYEDYPELSGFDCPEWSHLSAGDSVEFSKRLVPHLRKALQM